MPDEAETVNEDDKATSDPQGLLEAGNIDLSKRPIVKNADGTISTVRSMDVHLDDDGKAVLGYPRKGRRVLLPTVADDGKILSDEDAVAVFNETGRHLGKFDTAKSAVEYAKHLHDEQDETYSAKPSKKRGFSKRAKALYDNPRSKRGDDEE